jgi:hypothetical protein
VVILHDSSDHRGFVFLWFNIFSFCCIILIFLWFLEWFMCYPTVAGLPGGKRGSLGFLLDSIYEMDSLWFLKLNLKIEFVELHMWFFP